MATQYPFAYIINHAIYFDIHKGLQLLNINSNRLYLLQKMKAAEPRFSVPYFVMSRPHEPVRAVDRQGKPSDIDGTPTPLEPIVLGTYHHMSIMLKEPELDVYADIPYWWRTIAKTIETELSDQDSLHKLRGLFSSAMPHDEWSYSKLKAKFQRMTPAVMRDALSQLVREGLIAIDKILGTRGAPAEVIRPTFDPETAPADMDAYTNNKAREIKEQEITRRHLASLSDE